VAKGKETFPPIGIYNSLTFKPEMNLLGGIEQVISLIPQWQIRENTDGTIGIGAITDGRFEQPSTYVFERNKTCWSKIAEYDDEQTYSKLCITCKEPANTIYSELPPHKWWVSPKNKTKYIDVPDGTSLNDMQALANELSELIAISGKTETFAGIFTPQLIIGDIIELIETDGKHSVIGTVTSVRHTIGKGGFYTEFTVDSGGRKGKPLLKDFVGQISSNKKTDGVVIS